MALYLRMLFMMIISLYTSRVILDKLGEVDYGIYNVIGGFVAMFTVVSGTMATATQRYLSFEIGKGKDGDVSSIFSTTVLIHIIFAIIVLILGETIGLWFLNTHMNFPPGRYEAANWVFQYSLLAFLVNICMTPYLGAIIAYEKMTVFAWFSILEAILKLAICYVITLTAFDKLSVYACLIAATQIGLMGCYYIYCKRNISEIRTARIFGGSDYRTDGGSDGSDFWTGGRADGRTGGDSDFRILGRSVIKVNKQYIGSIFSFFGWNLIGSLAMVLKDQGVNIVLNMFFGPVVNAARGISYQVQSKINGFVSNFQVAMNPQIIKYYAAEQKEDMYKLVFRGAKISYLLLLTLSLPVIFEAPLILDVWLKAVPENTALFLRIILFTSLLNTLSNPLIISMHASGIVRNFQIVVGGLSLLTLPLVYLACRLGYDAYIGLIIVLVMEFLCHLARLYMLNRIIGFPAFRFFLQVTLRVIIVTLFALLLPWFAYTHIDSTGLRFLTVCLAALVSCITLGFYGALDHSERTVVASKVQTVLRKKLRK